MRGFVMEQREDESDLEYEIRQEMVRKLASEWSAANARREQQAWEEEDQRLIYGSSEMDDWQEEMAEQAYQDELDACSELTEREAHERAVKAREESRKEFRERRELDATRMDVIEDLLRKLGARMARPYEHWNEEERYMEYLENRGY